MVIDIVNYTQEQINRMPVSKRLAVTEAQIKKNRLEERHKEVLLKLRGRLIKNGTFYSEIYNRKKSELDKIFQNEVENLKMRLMNRLSVGETLDGSNVPYEVNYALSYEDRFIIVRNYYNSTYSDKKERYEAWAADKFAYSYLGDLYATADDYFYVLAYG